MPFKIPLARSGGAHGVSGDCLDDIDRNDDGGVRNGGEHGKWW